MFRVGQKVVCVNAKPSAPAAFYSSAEALIEGRHYTVCRVFSSNLSRSGTMLWLDEVCRDDYSRLIHGPDVGYGSWRFCPLVESQTDISIFKKMLVPKRRHELTE